MWKSRSRGFLLKWLDFAHRNSLNNSKCGRTLRLHWCCISLHKSKAASGIDLLRWKLAYFSCYLFDMEQTQSHLRAACVKTPLEKGCYNLTRAPSLKIKPLKMHGEATGSSLTTSLRDFSLISLLKGQYSKCHIQLGVYKGPVVFSGLWSGMQHDCF